MRPLGLFIIEMERNAVSVRANEKSKASFGTNELFLKNEIKLSFKHLTYIQSMISKLTLMIFGPL